MTTLPVSVAKYLTHILFKMSTDFTIDNVNISRQWRSFFLADNP